MANLDDDDVRELADLAGKLAANTARARLNARLDEHRRAGVPVQELADAIGVHRVHLSGQFRERGVTPQSAPRAVASTEPASAERVRAVLGRLGFDTSRDPYLLGHDVARRLGWDGVPPAHDDTLED